MDQAQQASPSGDHSGFAIVRSTGRIHAMVGEELDLYWIGRIGPELDSAIAYNTGDEVVVDLRGTAFIDSSALRFLLELNYRSKTGGFPLSIVIGDGQVRKVLEITGLMRQLPVSVLDGEVPFPSSA